MDWYQRQRAERDKRNRELRLQRMLVAREKGTHTLREWELMKKMFDYRCVQCSRQEPDIELVKDHVHQIYQGGCDCIVNIQPLCRSCNAERGAAIWHLKAQAQARL